MPEMRPKAAAKKRAQNPRSELRIPRELMRRLRREAAALRLDVPEYFALIVHGSEVLRQSLLPEGLKDAAVLRKVLDTPLLLDMVKATAQSVIRQAVREYLPRWDSKDATPEQLLDWLRSLGSKKTPPFSAAVPGPAREANPRQPAVYPMPWPPAERPGDFWLGGW